MGPYFLIDVLYFTLVISGVATLVVSLVRVKQHPYLNPILLLLLISVGCSFLNIYYHWIKTLSQPVVGIIYRSFEFFILIYFYIQILLTDNSRKFRLSILIILVFLAFVVVYFEVITIRTFNSFFFIIPAVLLYRQIMMRLDVEDVIKNSIFWLNNAFFVSFSGSLFLHLMRPFLIENYYAEYPFIFGLNNVLAIIKNMMIIYAFYLPRMDKYLSVNA